MEEKHEGESSKLESVILRESVHGETYRYESCMCVCVRGTETGGKKEDLRSNNT